MGKSIANIIWQGGRYAFATLFSFLVSLLGPIVAFVCVFLAAGFFILIVALAFLVKAVSSPENDSFLIAIGMIFLPMVFLFWGVVIGLGMVLFSGLCVAFLAWPLGLATEGVLRVNPSPLTRLVIYCLESFLVGGLAAGAWLWLQPLQIGSDLATVMAVLLFFATGGSIGGFGFAITATEQARRLVVWLLGRRANAALAPAA